MFDGQAFHDGELRLAWRRHALWRGGVPAMLLSVIKILMLPGRAAREWDTITRYPPRARRP